MAVFQTKPLPYLSIGTLLRYFPWRISVTWGLVVLENILMALIPLLIGFAIDDLLAAQTDKLLQLVAVMVALIVIAVARRLYDTRAYGDIRVQLGLQVDDRHRQQTVSARSARLDMARELVDFLEETMPEIITGAIQLLVSLVILWTFHWQLAATALAMALIMLLFYSFFHGAFYRFNGAMNEQKEQQVTILSQNRRRLHHHLLALKHWEIKLSDAEAWLYGMIFLAVTAFLVVNLWQSVHLIELTAGTIFSVVAYSWEYVEALIILPIALQEWARLHEITRRINAPMESE